MFQLCGWEEQENLMSSGEPGMKRNMESSCEKKGLGQEAKMGRLPVG